MGIDMITWSTDGRITDLKIINHPPKAINLGHRMMSEMLQKIKQNILATTHIIGYHFVIPRRDRGIQKL